MVTSGYWCVLVGISVNLPDDVVSCLFCIPYLLSTVWLYPLTLYMAHNLFLVIFSLCNI